MNWREKGNLAVRDQKYEEAIKCYEQALGGEDESVVYCNLSFSYLKMESPAKAAEMANRSIAVDSGNGKAFYRKAQALSSSITSREVVDGCRSEFQKLLAAQNNFKKCVELGIREAIVRQSLDEVRKAIFRNAVRGPVEIGTTNIHNIGMVAVRDIEAGEVLLEDNPIAFSKCLQWQEAAKDVVSQCRKLDSQTVEWALDLHEEAGDAKSVEEKLFCIWDSNGHSVGEIDFRFEEQDKVGAALFLSGSRINHSCYPNAVQSFCNKTARIRIMSLRSIKKGEEVTITYCPLHMNKSGRVKRLKFECSCERCEREQVTDDDEKINFEKRYSELSDRSVESQEKKNPNLRDEIAELSKQLEEDALQVLGEDNDTTFMITLLRCKLWAERKGALPSLERLQQYITRHMPPNWPILISTNMYIAIHKANYTDTADEEILQHINTAFTIHRRTLGKTLGGSGNEISFFWNRYREELIGLDITSLERANMLFAQCMN